MTAPASLLFDGQRLVGDASDRDRRSHRVYIEPFRLRAPLAFVTWGDLRDVTASGRYARTRLAVPGLPSAEEILRGMTVPMTLAGVGVQATFHRDERKRGLGTAVEMASRMARFG